MLRGQMNIQKTVIGAITFLACISMIVTNLLYTQNPILEPVVEQVIANYSLTWTPDGQSLVFHDLYEQTGAQVTDNSWYTYNVSTRALSVGSNLWPLYPNFSSPEETLFNVATLPDQPQPERSYVHPSPDGHHIVYTTWVEGRLLLALGDRQQQEVNVTDDPAYNSFGHLVEFNVHWSQDSSRFIVSNRRSTATVYRLGSNYANDLTNLVVERVDARVADDPVLSTYVLDHVFDISDDGNFLLISLHSPDYPPNNRTLFAVMSLNSATSSEIISGVNAEEVIAAGFSADNSYFTFINDFGIHQYDRTTQISFTLNTEITANWVDMAVFSPVRNSVAFVSTYGHDIYVVELSSIPPLATPTPSHTPQPTITPAN